MGNKGIFQFSHFRGMSANNVLWCRSNGKKNCLSSTHKCVSHLDMDITIQHPWFKRALGSLYPSRLFDQFFGEGLFEYDLLPFLSSTISPYYRQSLFRTVLESGISEVRSDRDKFVIFLDVKHFSPEDLTVKVLDDFVEIHGKHSERQDDHGYISREFHRRYRLPSNVDQASISCSLSADGMLTFSGPKIHTNMDSSHSDRSIPVSREEKPTLAPSS
uniref:Alpha-crystallin A chain n=2 Tax=Phascolarctos cinereus TaxID=38626 RepID=A0A6P5J7V4_PHACI|nr:alpha-crystallin A chain isoform X1 [Phascolarctos cinereus]